jgi:hypothetical protein
MSLSFPTSGTGHLVGQGHALPAGFDPAAATCGGAGAYCERKVTRPGPGRAWPCPTGPLSFDPGKAKWHWDGILQRVV